MRLVLLGDTHGFHPDVPDGDVLIYTGDFTQGWTGLDHVKDVAKWLGGMSHSHKFLIGGNHDGSLAAHEEQCRSILGARGIKYLFNQADIVDGIKIWGSPHHPQFAGVFGMNSIQLKATWGLIDRDTDVLVTHGPPYGILDTVGGGDEHLGDAELSEVVGITAPKIHAFGHIHDGYGKYETMFTTYYNVAICNERYEPVNAPVVVDI